MAGNPRRSSFLGSCSAISHLRAVTNEAHQRLETKLDVVTRLSDPRARPDMIRRYAAFHIPADAALGPYLGDIDGLDMLARRRTPLLADFAGEGALPDFPAPRSRAEALGMLYVLEGSTLGGRLILRMLAERGIADPDLAFLDPYGRDTGCRWRSFLSVLARETDDDEQRIAEAGKGALSGFDHAESVLCGGAA
jgi:heme oxygenase